MKMMYYGLLLLSLLMGSCAIPKGREFVAAFPEMYYQGWFPEISFVILSDLNTTVHFESIGFNISEDVHVQAMVEHTHHSDSLFYYAANLEVTDMTFYITSETDITLFCYNAMVHRGEGYVVLPTVDLATEYMVVTHIDNRTGAHPHISLLYTGETQTVFLVVAVEDATQVNVTLQIQGPLMAGGCGNGTFFNGERRTFTLNKYQVVGAYCEEDITGTLVTSDKPVAVISGHNHKSFMINSNHLLEMLLPLKSIGRSFVLPEPPTETGGAIYRVVGSEAATTVRSPEGILFSLVEGESQDIYVNSTTGSMYIEADRPVSVVQFTLKLASMAIVPPTSLFASDYDISKPVLNPTYEMKRVYVTVVVPTDKVLGLRPQIFPQVEVIKGSCFSVASAELTAGFYRLFHIDSVPFGAMMYLSPHFADYGIFTHPAGYNLTDDTVKLDCSSGICSDGQPYPCTCNDGYFVYHCNASSAGCNNVPCYPDSICEDLGSTYTCHCVNGSGGAHCEFDIYDHCEDNTCVSGTCVDEIDTFTCNCADGFTGELCETNIDECSTSPCVHGTCDDHVNNYTCTCEPGYTDQNCSTDIDECATNACVNGACVDHVNNYTCSCEPGYTGLNCSTDIDDCSSNPCVNGTCSDLPNMYTCTCTPGYEGVNCNTDIDECATSPCDNGACVDHVNNYTCTCDPGYTDRNCSTDVNECSTSPCEYGACVDHINNYTCTCDPGYTDRNCSTDIDECSSNPCVNGTCSDLLNKYTCTCTPGYEGINCDSAVDPCAMNPCQNSGLCTQTSNGFTCSCPAGFMGDTCETDIDDCVSNPCQNDGTCQDRIDAFECLCRANFTGLLCDILMGCTCPCLLNSTSDDSELAAKIKWLKSLLTIDKSSLSSARRKKVSVPDERPSSTGIGFSGICCLVAAFGFFLIPDFLNVIQALTRKKSLKEDPSKRKLSLEE